MRFESGFPYLCLGLSFLKSLIPHLSDLVWADIRSLLPGQQAWRKPQNKHPLMC